ncbi:MAG: hypothetical protein KF760_04740 [Candidatus Eremiobacteraeota bacterium]|nr:hypothetical protein [Candidatus Eremiobacteraeota bacterium]MCW5866981.1 hypothetical protein [Candidatus Eremiobacteraeota bacterium]
MLRSSSKKSKKSKQLEIPVTEYVAPTPAKKPPPTLYLFSNQIGLGRSFRERIG